MHHNNQDNHNASSPGVPLLNGLSLSDPGSTLPSSDFSPANIFSLKLESILGANPNKPKPSQPKPSQPKSSAALLSIRQELTEFLVELVFTISTLRQERRSSSGDDDNDDAPLLLPPRDEVDNLLLLVPLAYLHRCAVHGKLGYEDLAASDAYRALLCVERIREWNDEVSAEFEFEEGGNDLVGLFSKAIWDGLTLEDGSITEKRDDNGDLEIDRLGKLLDFIEQSSLCHVIQALIASGCIKVAQTYFRTATTKFPELQSTWEIFSFSFPRAASKPLPFRGLSRREVYPWNTYEPDRFAPSTLEKINASMWSCCISTSSSTADSQSGPWCEVRLVSLPRLHADGSNSTETVNQLGVFALRDIPAEIPGAEPGEIAPHPYLIEPSNLIISTITGGPPGVTVGVRCEMCTCPIPEDEQGQFSCEECEENDIWPSFCTAECQQKAMKLYHPAVCGTDWAWLHREANLKMDGGKDDLVFDDDAIYCLLLQRAWALALTQGKHPLELDEVWYLYGAGKRRTRYPIIDGAVGERQEGEEDDPVPFDFHQNVIVPHMILDSLGIEILPFPPYPDPEENDEEEEEVEEEEEEEKKDEKPNFNRSPTLSITHYDTSTSTLTLLNKFKGVATLTRHLDKRTHPPIETSVSAIHPLYSLINHNCDPNVYWQVNEHGEMCLRALSRELKFWRNGDSGDEGWEAGVRRGMEIKDSYVDPGLEVEERRRKTWGVLGGLCICERCIREEREKE